MSKVTENILRMILEQDRTQTKLLTSMAESLARMANPPMLVNRDGATNHICDPSSLYAHIPHPLYPPISIIKTDQSIITYTNCEKCVYKSNCEESVDMKNRAHSLKNDETRKGVICIFCYNYNQGEGR
jgi:hypothetical protein